ncbi:hypothetical protein EDD18DRAFT_1111705 [Armillaria luteobubalina]|uniref:Uncharacterized protein n=1 Tax=Armillaria luteobubalina TaxID=153913 RepID=A0AA39PI63_9AGAR|nr:hypothetical protein EDD18DRAFT_1111705 [Armillaria luteobubalina]
MSCPRSSSNNVFTPPPAPDAAVELIRCIDDVQVSLGFIQQRAICHLSTIQGAMMSTWHYPAWQQKNGYLMPVTAENLQQYMREWEVEGPNCFCPLMDPTLLQVQAILRRDDGDGQWSFICVSEYCEYRINLTRVFGPGLPQSALQNYAIGCDEGAPRTENLDYRSTFVMHPSLQGTMGGKHGRRWPLLQTGLSDIEESIEPNTTLVRAPGTVVPESDQEEGLNSPLVPRLDLTKRVPMSPTRNRRIVNPVTTRSKLGSTAKERRLSLQAQGAGGDSVQTEGGVLAKAPTGFRETTLFQETIPVLQRSDLWIHLTQTTVGVTSEELAGLLVKCVGCSKYYRDGLNHYCVE